MHWFLASVVLLLIVVSAYNYLYFDKEEKGEDVKSWVKHAKMFNLAALVLAVLALVYWLWTCYHDGKFSKLIGNVKSKAFSPSVYSYSPFDF